MPKDIPDCPDKFQPPEPDRRSEKYDLELITPLFGGGVEVRKNDEKHLISEKAIRGQLRFWWRATRGRMFDTPDALWRREEEIFGSTEFASPLRVVVNLQNAPLFASKRDFPQRKYPGYALFALQQGEQVICEGLKFWVTLSWVGESQLTRQRAAQNAARVKGQANGAA